MIPKLTVNSSVPPELKSFIADLYDFEGLISTSYSDRIIYATDNSIYQQLPQAVIYPKSKKDINLVMKTLGETKHKNIELTPRGGGTGTNGQSLTHGITMDLSRFMNKIIHVDYENNFAIVQPGVVLDQLNAEVAKKGKFFAPNLSPSSRATIGGMVNTDACGQGSLVYGKTAQHLIELDIEMIGGESHKSQKVDKKKLCEICDGHSKSSEIYRVVSSVVQDSKKEIEDKYPKMTRYMSGYNLAMVFNEKGEFNLNNLLAGSEGTLAVVSEIKLNLIDIPKYKALVISKYLEFNDGLKAAADLVSLKPSAIETVDNTILNLARKDVIWYEVKNAFSEEVDKKVASVNLIEFIAESKAELDEKVNKTLDYLEENRNNPKSAVSWYHTFDKAEIVSLWTLRKKGVGLLGNLEGERRPVPFIEDTAVPPENLGAYIKEFRKILDDHGLFYGMFGHVDAGCLHVRPALDLKNPDDEKLVRILSDKINALCKKYGGVVWGEHGTGFRGEYKEEFLGEKLYKAFREIKTVFDKEGQLNPGKIVTPIGSKKTVTKIDEVSTRGKFDRQIKAEVRSDYQEAMTCNGNGACFNYSPDYLMCPSYKETRDRLHSPKGRATMIREWLRLLSKEGYDPNYISSEIGKLDKAQHRDDFNVEVFESINGCLSCKACTNQCPIKVNIPELKAKFLNHFYSRYKRPAKDKLLCDGENLHAKARHLPRAYNLGLSVPLAATAAEKIIGVVDAPKLPVKNIFHFLKEYKLNLATKDLAYDESNVFILQDPTFTIFKPELVAKTMKVIEACGKKPYLLPYIENGKAFHVKGFLNEFKDVVDKATLELNEWSKKAPVMICLEPAIALTYREEYLKYSSHEAKFSVNLISEFLSSNEAQLSKANKKRFHLLSHCGEKSSLPASPADWEQIFFKHGLELKAVPAGCCSMAGAFGHEAEHLEASKRGYELSWKKKIEANENIVATGYSCHSQVKRFDDKDIIHPIEVLFESL